MCKIIKLYYTPILRESSSFPKKSYNSSITSTVSYKPLFVGQADEVMDDVRKGDIVESSILYVVIAVLASLTDDVPPANRLLLQLLVNDNSDDVVVRIVPRVEAVLADLVFFSMKVAY